MTAVEFAHDICFISPFICTPERLADKNTDNLIGGAELQMTRLATQLARRGYRVSFIVLGALPDSSSISAPSPFNVFSAYTPGKGLPGIRYFTNTVPGLWRALSKAQARVYYLRGAGGIAAYISLYCRRQGAKFVFAVANDHDLDFKPALPSLRDRFLFKQGREYTAAIVVQTELQQNKLEELGLQRKGVLLRSLCEAQGLAQENPACIEQQTILWAGRGRKIKRPDVFIDLARSLPNLPFTMSLIRMPHNEDYFARLQQAGGALPNLTFYDGVPYREMPILYARAGLLVNTSESEGFPNTFLEAWARKIPVVATVNPDDLLTRKQLGIYCPTVAELAPAVARLFADKTARERIGARAREYIINYHSIDAIMESFQALLDKLGVPHRDFVGSQAEVLI
jgi:glycosyltransferase involved in cell wall biosynthesis